LTAEERRPAGEEAPKVQLEPRLGEVVVAVEEQQIAVLVVERLTKLPSLGQCLYTCTDRIRHQMRLSLKPLAAKVAA
jgi:hypothetical protein